MIYCDSKKWYKKPYRGVHTKERKEYLICALVWFMLFFLAVGYTGLVNSDALSEPEPLVEVEDVEIETEEPVEEVQEQEIIDIKYEAVPRARAVLPVEVIEVVTEENEDVAGDEAVEEVLVPEPVFVIPHSDKERSMMEYVVEAEAYQSTLEHKIKVACVIVNRLNDFDRFGYSSLEEVMTAKNQFSAISNYYNKTKVPDADSIEAVRLVLSGEVDLDSESKGAVFFYSPKYAGGCLKSFEKRTFLFEIGGNRFFR